MSEKENSVMLLQKYSWTTLGRYSESKGESVTSFVHNRKGLEHFMCEDVNAQTVSCLQVPQAKSWAIKYVPTIVWPKSPQQGWETSGEGLYSAQLNQIVYAHILSGEDNWGLTGCQLSSWTMLDICYHDGKHASPGFWGSDDGMYMKGFWML